jgi:ferric-dicitrate binding protein FerR (iron transport regulator)
MVARLAWQRAVRARRRRRGWTLAVAASVVVLGALAVALHEMSTRAPLLLARVVIAHGKVEVSSPGSPPWQPLRIGAEVTAGTRLRTGADGGMALQLGNGASVRADRNSALELQARDVLRLDRGAMYVDTGANAASSGIRVETPIGSVSDLGTIFEVRTQGDDRRVRVREGRVLLTTAGSLTQAQSAAGEEIEVYGNGDVRRRALSPHGAQWRWAEALAVAPDIEGLHLAEFLVWVARQTGRRLRFAEPETEARARAVVLHGKATDLAPLDALELVLSTTDLEYVLPSDEVIIVRKRRE